VWQRTAPIWNFLNEIYLALRNGSCQLSLDLVAASVAPHFTLSPKVKTLCDAFKVEWGVMRKLILPLW
jgi:hypothetical protein